MRTSTKGPQLSSLLRALFISEWSLANVCVIVLPRWKENRPSRNFVNLIDGLTAHRHT